MNDKFEFPEADEPTLWRDPETGIGYWIGTKSGGCPECGLTHFPLKTYRAWIKKYDGKMKSPYAKEQVVRWQAIVDSHARKPKNALNAE